MPSAIRRDGGRPKILHVEDNPENRMLVRAILEAEGYILAYRLVDPKGAG